MLLHTIIRSQCFLLWKPIIELGREMKGFASGANLVSAPPSGEYRKAMCIFNLLKTNRNTIMWHPCSTGCEESDVSAFVSDINMWNQFRLKSETLLRTPSDRWAKHMEELQVDAGVAGRAKDEWVNLLSWAGICVGGCHQEEVSYL